MRSARKLERPAAARRPPEGLRKGLGNTQNGSIFDSQEHVVHKIRLFLHATTRYLRLESFDVGDDNISFPTFLPFSCSSRSK